MNPILKRNLIYMGIFFVLFWTGAIFLARQMPYTEGEMRMQRMTDKFLKNSVRGTIEELDWSCHRNYCKLNDGYEFYFKWDISRYPDEEFDATKKFDEYAQKGDSIIKYKQQDYFLLKKKNGKVFRYFIEPTFKK